MSGKTLPKFILTVASLLLMIVLGACTDARKEDVPSVTPQGAFAVDPLFREFYDLLGGEKVMGPAISPLFTYGSRKYQYIQAGCLEYDSGAPTSQRFRLAPLGLDMGIQEPENVEPCPKDQLCVNGHVIFPGFVEIYRKLGGARFVGKPLTDPHYNTDKLRTEQYFENLGLYWIETDPPDKIYLLAYGAWKCDNHCRYVPSLNSIIDLPSLQMPPQSQIFRETVARLGADFTGFALTDPYQAPDGNNEQIYENIVLYADPQNPEKVRSRPVPILLGILKEPPTSTGPTQGFVLWPTSGDKGFNVPQPFLDYISAHGGPEVSGPPIGQLALANNQVWQQCFRNLCLEYSLNSDAPADYRIHPKPLGRAYRDLYYRSENNASVDPQSLKSVGVQVWEKHQFISSDQNNEISAYVHEGDTPLQDIEPDLVVILPDGSQRTYPFPPTGKDGKTSIKLDKIIAQNGTLIQYQVCVNNLTRDLYCVKDSFVIWYNP